MKLSASSFLIILGFTTQHAVAGKWFDMRSVLRQDGAEKSNDVGTASKGLAAKSMFNYESPKIKLVKKYVQARETGDVNAAAACCDPDFDNDCGPVQARSLAEAKEKIFHKPFKSEVIVPMKEADGKVSWTFKTSPVPMVNLKLKHEYRFTNKFGNLKIVSVKAQNLDK